MLMPCQTPACLATGRQTTLIDLIYFAQDRASLTDIDNNKEWIVVGHTYSLPSTTTQRIYAAKKHFPFDPIETGAECVDLTALTSTSANHLVYADDFYDTVYRFDLNKEKPIGAGYKLKNIDEDTTLNGKGLEDDSFVYVSQKDGHKPQGLWLVNLDQGTERFIALPSTCKTAYGHMDINPKGDLAIVCLSQWIGAASQQDWMAGKLSNTFDFLGEIRSVEALSPTSINVVGPAGDVTYMRQGEPSQTIPGNNIKAVSVDSSLLQ